MRLAKFSCSPFEWRLEQVERGRAMLASTRELASAEQKKSMKSKKLIATIDSTFDNLSKLLAAGPLTRASIQQHGVKHFKLFGCCDKHLKQAPTAPCVWAKMMVDSIWRYMTTELLFPEHTRKFIKEYSIDSLASGFDLLDQIFAQRFAASDFDRFVHVSVAMGAAFINNLGDYMLTQRLQSKQVLRIAREATLAPKECSEASTRLAILTHCLQFGKFDPKCLSTVPESMQPRAVCDEIFKALFGKQSRWATGNSLRDPHQIIEFRVAIDASFQDDVVVNMQPGVCFLCT
jgi:hypothetical protein